MTTSRFKIVPLIVPFILAFTLLVQLFCCIPIMYCKWQQWKKDRNNVIPIRILPHNHENDDSSPRIQKPDQGHTLNTSLTNKILPDLKHIICFLLSTLTLSILQIYKKHLFLNYDLIYITKESKLMMHVINLTPKFLFCFIFPLMFYLSHKELRNYWKTQFIAFRNMNK